MCTFEGCQCQLPGWDTEGLCILHSRDESKNTGEKRELFMEELDKKIRADEETERGQIVLKAVVFPESVHLIRKFLRDANFFRVKFIREANFGSATFTKDADFGDAKFEGNANFSNATFAVGSRFVGARVDKQVDFSEAEMTGAVFYTCLLTRCKLRGATGLEQTRFENVDWPNFGPKSWTQRRGVLGDEVVARRSRRPEDFAAAEAIYHQLLKNYELHRDFPEAELFHYGEMEMRRLRRFEPVLTVYGALSGYGHAWFQSFCWLVAVVILWSFFYGLSGLTGQGTVVSTGLSLNDVDWDTTVRLLVYSVRSAVLQPDRDLRPETSLGQLAQAVQFVLGPLLIALTGIALRRKFRR